MKIRTIISWVVVITVLAVLPAMAKDGFPLPDPSEIMDQMTAELGLSDEQVDQIRPLVEERMEKQKELFEKNSSQGKRGMLAMKSEMESLAAESDAKIISYLTPEQVDQYYTFQEAQRENMKSQMRGRMRSGN